MKFTKLNSIFLIFILHLYRTANTLYSTNKSINKISIGFVYCDSDELIQAQQVVNQLNYELQNVIITSASKSKLRIELKSLKLSENDNTISLSVSVCDSLMNRDSIYGVVIGRSHCLRKKYDNILTQEREYILALSSVSFTCAYYQIPVLDLYSRESEFTDKSLYSSFIRMSPPYFHQASIWIELIKEFDWKSINLIRSVENDGKMFASRFQYLADQQDIKVNKISLAFILIFSYSIL
jgi:hypothetical protein